MKEDRGKAGEAHSNPHATDKKVVLDVNAVSHEVSGSGTTGVARVAYPQVSYNIGLGWHRWLTRVFRSYEREPVPIHYRDLGPGAAEARSKRAT
jgi:hypothetical protein